MANPLTTGRTFIDETMAELKRSSWPTRKELIDSTIIVIASMLLLAAYVAVADFVFVNFVRILTGNP